jgi:hypothetical protein
MISDTLVQAENDIISYLESDTFGYKKDPGFTARMGTILDLMRFVRIDLDCPEGPGITEFPVVASIRASRPEIDADLNSIAEKLRGIFRDHGINFDSQPGDDTQPD